MIIRERSLLPSHHLLCRFHSPSPHTPFLTADLDDKYMLIFQNYGLDLNEVQGIYEKHKHQPPKVRNAPPVAGSILWSRQLLTRIEEPMRRFSQNKSILQLRESKKIIKTYNRVARALIEFETLWHQAWIKSIDTAKAGLQATLIVRHPETGRLLVNFDREILQLIKEAKYLQRMGLSVPESAKMVLLQEDKFKYYYNKLTYIIREYDRICRSILQVAKPLLAPHVEEMEKKIQPGMYILTWTSMNIDGYLNRVTQGLSNLEELARKVNDILENRVEGNIRAIARSSMISLPTDTTITFEEFVTGQSKHIKQQTELLKIRNVEINRALEDAESLLTGSGPEDLAVNADDVSTFKQFYAGMMYNALLGCTKRSLQTVKKRLGARGGNSWLQLDKPLFEINIELAMPTIRTQPSLEEIQTAINTTAKRVLKSTVEIKAWGPQVRLFWALCTLFERDRCRFFFSLCMYFFCSLTRTCLLTLSKLFALVRKTPFPSIPFPLPVQGRLNVLRRASGRQGGRQIGPAPHGLDRVPQAGRDRVPRVVQPLRQAVEDGYAGRVRVLHEDQPCAGGRRAKAAGVHGHGTGRMQCSAVQG